MVKEREEKDRQYFVCKVCGLVYSEKKWADACNEFCSKNNACSPEIARHSVRRM